MSDALDDAFPHDLDEILEGVLATYRPILSHLMTANFRGEMKLCFERSNNLAPWVEALGRPAPVHGIGPLTPAQVALLGGTRPRSIPHCIVTDLHVPLDGGAPKDLREAYQILLSSDHALRSLVEHHVVVPVRGPRAAARRLRALADLGVAAQIAALMGTLHERSLVRSEDEESDFIQRYFLEALQTFGRISLSRGDRAVFRDYYVDEAHIEELAEERSGELSVEVERRRGFLKRLAAALRAESARGTGAGRAPVAEDPQLPAQAGAPRGRVAGDGEGRALMPAVDRAAPRRKR
jgi:hypothetical protein